MLKQIHDDLTVPTQGRGLYEITREVGLLLRRSGLREGLLTLLLRHTSASLLIQENADPDVRQDLERFFRRHVPDGDPLYSHTLEGPDDMPAHVRTALTAVTLSVPFREGRLMLGTWQGIYVWEHRTSAHGRQVALHWIGT